LDSRVETNKTNFKHIVACNKRTQEMSRRQRLMVVMAPTAAAEPRSIHKAARTTELDSSPTSPTNEEGKSLVTSEALTHF
jgi:hypothetical protein